MGPTAPIKRLRRLLTSENLWLYVLSLLRRKKKLYAYELDDAIEKGFGFRPNKIMIYIVLYKLEGEGLIRSEFQERRKYYELTEKGAGALGQARGYFKTLSAKL
ncbi:MAG: PadR family transcriptional regulator [Candidatus ainarchaeum sp.]|nr:PadR family transcriptional regulator [Candidatus ainarchaeum sp.]